MALALNGCEKGVHDMYAQPKYGPLASSPLFVDGNASRNPVPGTVASATGAIADASGGMQGNSGDTMAEAGATVVFPFGRGNAAPGPTPAAVRGNPRPITTALLARGRERFDIDCSPCHGRLGDGNGPVAMRGFPHPPTYHSDRLRAAPDTYFYDVIANGYGVMFPYRNRVAPQDRWAIIAYIRALQLSQHADAASLPDEDRRALARVSP
jgi:mono/diheme cytochrome c family protein